MSLAVCAPTQAQREVNEYQKSEYAETHKRIVIATLTRGQFGMNGWVETAELSFLDERIQLSEIALFDDAPSIDLSRAATPRFDPLIRSALNAFGAVAARHALKPYPNEVADFSVHYRITFATERGARAFVAFINDLTSPTNAAVLYDMNASIR